MGYHFFTVQIVLFFLSFQSFAANADYVPGEVIVRYKASKKLGLTSLGKTGLRHNLSLKRSWEKLGVAHFKLNDRHGLEETLESLNQDPEVLFAEPNYIVRAQAGEEAGEASDYSTVANQVKVFEGWAQGFQNPQGSAPVVAVIDSGIGTHELFNGTGRLWENSAEANGLPGVDDDGNGYIDDVHGWNFIDNSTNLNDGSGHGTHVASIVLGSTEDISSFDANESPAVKLMILKFLDDQGVGRTSDAIEAIYYAVNNGAKILNNSWGGPGYSAALHEAVFHSFSQNTLFVAAAGNENSNNDEAAIFPGNFDVPNVISVGASLNEQRSVFSNFGLSSVDVFSPGQNIFGAGLNGGYVLMDGTSMAAPMVSGLAALMSFEVPHFTGYQLKENIMNTVDEFSGFAGVSVAGGRLNFLDAVSSAQANSSQPSFSPEYTPTYLTESRSLASLDEDSGGAGCGRVKALYTDFNREQKQVNPKSLPVVFFFVLPVLLLISVRLKLSRKKFLSCRRRSKRTKANEQGCLRLLEGFEMSVKVCDISKGGVAIESNKTQLQLLDRQKSDQVYHLSFKTRFGKTKTYKCMRVAQSSQGKFRLVFV